MTADNLFESARSGLLCPKCGSDQGYWTYESPNGGRTCACGHHMGGMKGFIPTAIFTKPELAELIEKVRKEQ